MATNDELTARLDTYARRLYETVTEATQLHAVFSRLNESAVGHDGLVGPIAHAYNIIQSALLRELILIVVRVLDRAPDAAASDKVSFCIIGQWFERADVVEALLEKARLRHGEHWARRNTLVTRWAIRRVRRRLNRLRAEEPNRERLLRHYRNDFLAHELHREIPRDQPMFRHLIEMIGEIQELCLDAVAACTGFGLEFDHVYAEANEGAEHLWKAVAERQFTWHPKKGLEPK